MKKRIFFISTTLISIIIICLSLSIGAYAVYASTATIPKVKTFSPEYYANVNKGVEIWMQIMPQYKTQTVDSNGETKICYSDDFGGVFVDEEGILNIGIVGSIRGKPYFSGQVVYRRFKFSYNYLQKIMDELSPVMENYGIYEIGINDECNQVSICLYDEKEIGNVIKYLSEKGFNKKSAINISAGPGISDL